MAAKHCYRKGFLLLLFNFISTAALEKRFSDFKRCADEECSMLLCRGKAMDDFSGPDCRFLSVKKSETVYVYYKLSGRRADMWAGSVGSNFGYFPKELLTVNHVYTDKEIELPAEETDFVCFDTGFAGFDNYDVDSLLGSSEKENDSEIGEASDPTQVVEGTQKDAQPSEEAIYSDEVTEPYSSEDLGMVPDDQSASLPQPVVATESPSTNVKESDTAEVDDAERDEEDAHKTTVDSRVPESADIANSETKEPPTKQEVTSEPKDVFMSEEEPASISKAVQIPDVKTTFGTTFDAVTTDAVVTMKTTPEEDQEQEEESENIADDLKDDSEVETPLLSYSEDATNTVSLEDRENAATEHDSKPKTEEKGMWTSLGDAVFSVVTGGERTKDLSSDEDEDDEEEASEILQSFVEDKKDTEPEVPENMDPKDSSSVQTDKQKMIDDPEKLLFDHEDVETEKMTHDDDEPLKPADEPIQQQVEAVVIHEEPQSLLKTTGQPSEEEEEMKYSEVSFNEYIQDSSVVMEPREEMVEALDKNKTGIDRELVAGKTETQQDPSLIRDDAEKTPTDSVLDGYDHIVTELEGNNSRPERSAEELQMLRQLSTEESEDEKFTQLGEEIHEEKGLLEDENALLFSQSDQPSPETSPPVVPVPEPEYSDSVLRLTLLQGHFTQESMMRFRKFLGLKNLYKVEAMFSDLDTELEATRRLQSGTTLEIEDALENILEASENTILDEIEKILDNRDREHEEHNMDTSTLDEEAEILDEFQELAFSLRQKHSTVSDSAPMAETSKTDQDNQELNVKGVTSQPVAEEERGVPATESDDNFTITELEEEPAKFEKETLVLDEVHTGPEVSVAEDGGHFNRNKDNQPHFSASDEMQKVPQAALDMGLGVEVEQLPSGSLDTMEPVSEFHVEEEGLLSTGVVYMGCIISMMKTKVAEWIVVMISLLPEEWKPGESFYGCPWQAVAVTALVGIVTFTLFFWRTVLAVKKKEYLVDDKKLTDQIQALKKEKDAVLFKMSELKKQTEQLKEDQERSVETDSCTMKKMQDLEREIMEARRRREEISEEKISYEKQLQEEQEKSLQNETRIQKLEKSNEKLQLSRKKIQEAFAKTSVLLDEARIREDARNVQHKCLEKEFAALKEENKTLKATIKGWEDKHLELSEQIKVYQKSQKELEDSVVLKDHNVEVLSELLADLDACEVLANGEIAPDKKTAVKNRIKQMMDVSRVKTTLSVIEEERDRFMSKLLNEEKSRKELEEQHQVLEHAIATLKSEKSHIENQFTILQQKNEIMVEMYQQKENALQQRLTKEELERRSKENLLSEVGGKAVEAEEQVKVLRQRINEMEEQMKKTEEVYKEQIKEQENKTHSNWVNARNAERALNQEKLESSKLREKLAVLTSQLNERRAPLFRPNSGQPAGLRQGDSYGPSPVSGGAPSPPLMIEGPRRPPSAPVGRRIDPYGPRPPSDPHGRYPDNKHISGMDMSGPRSSSPANMDGSTQAVEQQVKAEPEAEASTESPEPGPGSFLASPIRDSPGPMIHGPPPGPGHHDPLLPPGPHGRLPPAGAYRPPRPGLYHPPPGPHGPPPPGPPLPANGHPGLPPPGQMGDFGPRPNGHVFHPRPGPGHFVERGPPPPHFRPPPPHHFGPVPPPHVLRGPMGPRPPIPPDMRFPGPRDLTGPPMDLPPGVPPHPAHAGAYGPAAGAGQDLPLKQEASQDSVRPAMVEP